MATPLQSILSTRQMRLAEALRRAKLDALVLNPGPSLTYLTGLHFHLSERPVVMIFFSDGPPLIILPELETPKLSGLPFQVQSFPYGEDPAAWPSRFRQALQSVENLGLSNFGVEPQQLRVLELRLLENAVPAVTFLAAETVTRDLRIRKDTQELAAMRTAVSIAQQALEATLPSIQTGMPERELASELTLQLLRAGSDSQLPFSPIVSAGANSANPHASPSDRQLQAGDLLVIDWGASYQGYFSDLTRTFAVGKVSPEMQLIARIVSEANAAGRKAARPGVQARRVDDAARQVIEQAGYGQYFIHRTGHGLGMESHEEPYIHSKNTLVLETGMVFTVEPGIYLPGRNGVRIEDDVVITDDGADSLSDLSRQLQVVG